MKTLISSTDLRKLLFKRFPLLNEDRCRMSDPLYLLPSREDLEQAVNDYTSKHLSFMPSIGECEEFTMYLRSDIAKARHIAAIEGKIPDDEKYSLAIGEADGLLNDDFSEDEPHTMGLAITDDKKIYYIENQSAKIYEYDLKYFSIYRIWM